jgi:hypothetical protein
MVPLPMLQRFAFPALLLVAIAVATSPLSAQSDHIATSGGNEVADAKAWWSKHTDSFRTQTEHCLSLLDEAEQHRELAMQYKAAAKRAQHEEASRLNKLGNDEYTIVNKLVRKFYECARLRSDQFNTQGEPGDAPAKPTPDDISTYGSGPGTGSGSGRGSGAGSGSGSGHTRPQPPPRPPGNTPPPPTAPRSDRFEMICNLRRLAALTFERYGTNRPIARWKVRNARTPTYLITLSGFEKDLFGHGKNTVGQLLLAWSNIQAFDAYRIAVFRAIADLPPTTNIILVGHSQGGMEAQNVVRSLVERWGYRVPLVISYGAPITTARQQGTAYLHVRAPDDPLLALDQKYNLSDREIHFSNRRTENPHTSYPTEASGLEPIRVPGVSVLSTPCLEIDLTTVRDYEAPDLFRQFFGPPAPRAARTPLNPQAGMGHDPTDAHSNPDEPNVDVNCFWVSLARDRFFATGIPVPARCEARPIQSGAIPPILERQYGDVPLDDLHGPTAAEGRARHRAGQKAPSSRESIEHALGEGDARANGRRGLVFVREPSSRVGHVFNARNVAGRIEYSDDQQGHDPSFWFDLPVRVSFYRTN